MFDFKKKIPSCSPIRKYFDADTKALLLQNIPRDLAVFAYMYCKGTLGLPRVAERNGVPSVDELNNVLLRYLRADKGGRH
jgi:hypothetical protein